MERSTALHGIRILDFGWAMAGPQGTRILADFGAEVIKVESRARIDLSRTQFGPFVEGERTLESCGYFNNFNRGKLSVTLNTSKPKAKELLRRLLSISDAVLENFSAGVLEKWGFGYEEMCKIKPDIVYASMAGFGHSGPYRDYRSYGPTIAAVSGLTHLAGFPDQEPSSFGFSFMDHTGGFYGCMALLQGLFHKMRTGQGQYIDVAQVEAALTLSGVSFLDFAVNGRPSRRIGNRSEQPPMAPHGIYRSADEDRWVAIACRNEIEWERFCDVLRRPEWLSDPRFARLSTRMEHQDELDRLIEAWTIKRSPHETMTRLQAAGIPAGAVQLPCEVVDDDPHIRDHGLYPEIEHPQFGVTRYDGMPARLGRTPGGPYRHGPIFGEHNDYVYGELLGIDEDERRALADEGVIW